MKSYPILSAGLALSMLVVGSSSVEAGSPSGDEILNVLPLRLARPQWRPLTAQEIKDRVSDQVVVVEKEYKPAPGVTINGGYVGGCPPSETFFADGRWEMGMCQRVYRTFKGRWFTEPFRGGDRLCTEADDRSKECRFVWQGSSVDQIVMSQQSLADANELCDDFNPYRVAPRAPERTR